MGDIENRLALEENPADHSPNAGQLLALVDALHAGTLNETQKKTVHELRTAILVLVDIGDETKGGTGESEPEQLFERARSLG